MVRAQVAEALSSFSMYWMSQHTTYKNGRHTSDKLNDSSSQQSLTRR